MIDQLFVIGNGFDKAHGYHTSYSDFRTWMEKELIEAYPELQVDNSGHLIVDEDPEIPTVIMGNHEEELADERPAIYLLMWLLLNTTKIDDKWNKFEEVLYDLGLEDVINANDWFIEDSARDREGDINLFILSENYDNMANDLASSVLFLQEIFVRWINDVEILNTKALPIEKQINDKSLFLSFNYTETLEKIYGVKGNRVDHIHGLRHKAWEYQLEDCLFPQTTNLIIGHGKDDIRNFGFKKIEQESMNEILIDTIKSLRKPVSDIIRKHDSFWQELKRNNIKSVYSFGFSYADVDMPYIQKIVSSLNGGRNVIWYLHSHDNKDGMNSKYEEKIKECGFKGVLDRFD